MSHAQLGTHTIIDDIVPFWVEIEAFAPAEVNISYRFTIPPGKEDLPI